jgi:hypothetical protein
MANVDVPTFAAQTRMGGKRTFAAPSTKGSNAQEADVQFPVPVDGNANA